MARRLCTHIRLRCALAEWICHFLPQMAFHSNYSRLDAPQIVVHSAIRRSKLVVITNRKLRIFNKMACGAHMAQYIWSFVHSVKISTTVIVRPLVPPIIMPPLDQVSVKRFRKACTGLDDGAPAVYAQTNKVQNCKFRSP